MCFSAEADLVAGVVVGGAGIDALRHVRHRREIALATLPLVFGTHQMIETLTWWGLDGHIPSGLGEAATWPYLAIAFVLPILAAHGIKHLRNRDKTMRWTASIGFSAPALQWFFMSFAEIGVGLSLVLGLLTSVGAAGLVALMTVAFWTVHRGAGFWITARPDEGWEYVFVLAAAAAALALLGPGEWSLDDALGLAGDLGGTTGALIAGGGVIAAAGHLAVSFRASRASG